MINKNNCLTGLLENPSLLEHESFTELLKAVSYLDEALRNRKNVKNLTTKDTGHTAGDMKRAYNLHVYQ